MNKKLFRQGLATHFPFMMVAAAIFIVGCSQQEREASSLHEGHGYADLGLPSGTMWATVNLGGEEDSLATDYYSWGETETKMLYCMNSYQWAEGYPNAHENILEKDDVAHVKWGGKWRLPTKEEFAELEDTIHNTTWIPSPIKGRVSWIVKSKRNNQSIRLTAFGYKKGKLEQDSIGFYLGATIGTSIKNTFACMGFSKDTINMGEAGRYFGYSVRPVFR